jgi:hypothetical protein
VEGLIMEIRRMACYICGQKKVFYISICKKCNGTGQIRNSFYARGEWTPKELRRNPFLPYYKDPPLILKYNTVKCSSCMGTGKKGYCVQCISKNPWLMGDFK